MIRPEELLAMWEEIHGTLKFRPLWRKEFLSREEIFEIVQFPSGMIRDAVRKSRNLKEILALLNAAEKGGKRNREPFKPERPIAGNPPKRTFREAEKENWRFRGRF